jgi:FkbM family methyltransferase
MSTSAKEPRLKSLRAYLRTALVAALGKRHQTLAQLPLARYLRDFRVDCILDVGANRGQYARAARKLGYRGRIESFEPLPSVLEELENAARRDGDWFVHRYALGSENCSREINISTNLPSSSFLPLDEAFDPGPMNLTMLGKTSVEIRRLDDVFVDIRKDAKSVLMKVDTQGFERQVIEGATHTLPSIAVVQMELSLVPNYSGETLIEEMIRIMRERDFVPWWILEGFYNPNSLQLYQVDVFFVRRAAMHKRI